MKNVLLLIEVRVQSLRTAPTDSIFPFILLTVYPNPKVPGSLVQFLDAQSLTFRNRVTSNQQSLLFL